MAMTKLAKDDYITQSFGEMGETAQNGTYGLTVGGIYQSAAATVSNGEWCALNTDATGNLMVNLASGDSVSVTVGTINSGTINAGTINAGTINSGTINAGTINAATVDVLKAGTINHGTIDSGTINAGTINAGTINSGTINHGTIDLGTIVHPVYSAAQTITVGSGATSGTLTSTLNGMIWKVTEVTPDLQGTPGSAAVFLKDSLGGTIASLGTQVESSIANYGTQVPINTDFNWICNTSGDPDGTQTADVNVVVLVHYQK